MFYNIIIISYFIASKIYKTRTRIILLLLSKNNIVCKQGSAPRSYKSRQTCVFECGFFSTARIASTNTSCRFSFFLAEHSTNAYARILCFNFLPSSVVRNFSEFGMRRSLFVPAIMIEICANFKDFKLHF